MSYAERAYKDDRNPVPEHCHHIGVWQEREWLAARRARAAAVKPR